MTGTVVISLDFELGWGHRRTRPEYVDRIRQRADKIELWIRRLLGLFDDYEIAATWAVVGKLLEDGSDPVFSNPALIGCVQDSGIDHEIGLHSYAHQPFDDMIKSEVRDDVSAGQQILSEYGIEPESFVFPQNRIAHLDILAVSGIRTYRDKLDDGWLPSVVRQFVSLTVSASESLMCPVVSPWSFGVRTISAVVRLGYAIQTDGVPHLLIHPCEITVLMFGSLCIVFTQPKCIVRL